MACHSVKVKPGRQPGCPPIRASAADGVAVTPPRLPPAIRLAAVGAVILTGGAIVAYRVTEPPDGDRSTITPVVVPEIPDQRYSTVTLVDRVGPCPGHSVALAGADGARGEISACLDPDRPPLDIGPERTLFFRVRLANTGDARIPARLAPGTGLSDKAGNVYMADLSRSLPTDPDIATDSLLEPGEKAELALAIPVLRETEPMTLSIVHPMDSSATWWLFE